MPQKDPAILFYFDHWRGGTMTMPRFIKGCYIDLLDAQFNNGHLSLEEIRTVLGNDFAAWGSLSKKFAVDATGKYFNERLESEMNKRKEFSNKQKERVNKRWNKSGIDPGNTAVLPNVNVDIDINKNKIKDKGCGEKEKILMPFTSEKFRVLWQNWKNYRLQEFKKKYKSSQSEQAALSHLANISGGNEEIAKEVIAQSLANQWQGLFELKNPQNGEHGNKNGKAAKITGAELDTVFAKRYPQG